MKTDSITVNGKTIALIALPGRSRGGNSKVCAAFTAPGFPGRLFVTGYVADAPSAGNDDIEPHPTPRAILNTLNERLAVLEAMIHAGKPGPVIRRKRPAPEARAG